MGWHVLELTASTSGDVSARFLLVGPPTDLHGFPVYSADRRLWGISTHELGATAALPLFLIDSPSLLLYSAIEGWLC